MCLQKKIWNNNNNIISCVHSGEKQKTKILQRERASDRGRVKSKVTDEQQWNDRIFVTTILRPALFLSLLIHLQNTV